MTNTMPTTQDAVGLPRLTPLELGVLEACHEVTARQRELVPLLADTLGVPEEKVFHTWAFRRCRQSGPVKDTDWRFFFHGLECDLKNVADGRFLRIDFGPGGRLDTFTAWGVLQFIMTSTPPWPEFPDLQQQFAEKGLPYDPYSGSLTKMGIIWDRLAADGVFEQAAPDLVKFEDEHTSMGADGLRHVRFPPSTLEETRVDCAVAHRLCLSRLGHHILQAPIVNGDR